MELNNEFVVEASAQDTWRLLTDLERVAPCMPGAALVGREGDDYIGTVKIKVGPIGAHFQGRARFLDQNDAAHTATISMSGKDTKGAAAANATIRARLEPVSEGSTRVYVDTDLDITGRMAQFGRGAIADVSNRILGQFTANLGTLIASSQDAQPRPHEPAVATGTNHVPYPQAAPAVVPSTPSSAGAELNAFSLVGPMVLKQAAIPAAAFILGWLVGRAFPRRPR